MKTPCLRNISLFTIFLSAILLAAACKKSSTTSTTVVVVPTVITTGVIINLTSVSAQSGGIVTSNGGAAIQRNGVCYSTSDKTPTITDSKTSDSVNTSGVANVPFVSTLTGLTGGTTYYLRAYATNSAGTAYGNVITFTTSSSLYLTIATSTTFAGNGTSGYADGTGTSALFNSPQGVAVDSKGNLYVSDSFNNRIRAITPGAVVSSFAGNGTLGLVDGPAANAEFYGPAGLAADAAGNIYVADLGANVIRKITPTGTVSTLAGNGTAGQVDGAGTVAEFNNPYAVAVDAATGNIYVADRGNNIIRKVTPAGVVSTFAGTHTAGYVNGTGIAAAFTGPSGIVVDASGNIYVDDTGNSAIRKITPAGVVTTLVGAPSQSALLNAPVGLAIDAKGDLFITDEGGRVLELTAANVLYPLAGSLNVSGFVDGSGTAAQFSDPQGIAVDSNGNIYVADQYNNCIRKITIVTVTTP